MFSQVSVGVGMSKGVGTHHSPPGYMEHGILRYTVDKRAVRMLLECFLVKYLLWLSTPLDYQRKPVQYLSVQIISAHISYVFFGLSQRLR